MLPLDLQSSGVYIVGEREGKKDLLVFARRSSLSGYFGVQKMMLLISQRVP